MEYFHGGNCHLLLCPCNGGPNVFDPSSVGDVLSQLVALKTEEDERLLNSVATSQSSELEKVGNDPTGSIPDNVLNFRNMLSDGIIGNVQSSTSGKHEVNEVSENQKDILCRLQEEMKVQISRDGELLLKLSPEKYQNYAPYCASLKRKFSRSYSNLSQVSPQGMAGSGRQDLNQKHKSTSLRQRNISADCLRRRRITERVKALQGLLPHSTLGGQASIMDHVIDYVEYLQLQAKDLARSRLGSQLASDPLCFLEVLPTVKHSLAEVITDGCQDEPLEEIMGKMLELNPLAATMLLESRGLFVVPISFVEGL